MSHFCECDYFTMVYDTEKSKQYENHPAMGKMHFFVFIDLWVKMTEIRYSIMRKKISWSEISITVEISAFFF